MHDKVATVLPHAGNGDDTESFNLIDVLAIFARQRKIMVVIPILTMIAAIAAAFLMKPFFVSTAAILPPQQATSAASMMLSQLGGLSAAAGGLGGLKNPNDIYVGMLQSRTISDQLITQFKLQERYDETTMDDVRKELLKKATFISGKDGMIRIAVEDSDPRFAAQLANAYVEQLVRLTRTLAVTEAARRRLYFEGQLKTVKNQLAEAEVTMRKMQETTGMLQLDAQVKSIIANEAQLQGMIGAKEVQLSAMRSFATANNPEYIRLQEEVRGLNAQLGKLKKGQESSQGDAMMATRKIPEVGVEYIRSLREVKYYETMFEMMAKQYELAKIDESKDSSVIQLLDAAVVPEKKSGPQSGRLLLGGLFGGIVLAAIIALLRDSYLRMRSDVGNLARWAALRQAYKQ
ncbi:GumC family protein [Janthinobacterium tructae]|uniref:Polysaccharide chain length determinant N-terminal domain-containing protein n=1 Tax=Janthinobacterium tructae TaxID=2590869 RepID=A0A4Y6RH79_9BURK|nr:Wzz/FepE/Etk N-terminal domain-containing protein [Janthinobacterium tructae]QDG71794.1 hypothetical protein FJQ89_16230 [Janthinobacterium tructae]